MLEFYETKQVEQTLADLRTGTFIRREPRDE